MDKIIPTYSTAPGVPKRARRAPGTLTKEERKEYVRRYNKAYKEKLKAQASPLVTEESVRSSKRLCRHIDCSSPTHYSSYWYCYRHHINTSDKNND